jgi:hypothetical protein
MVITIHTPDGSRLCLPRGIDGMVQPAGAGRWGRLKFCGTGWSAGCGLPGTDMALRRCLVGWRLGCALGLDRAQMAKGRECVRSASIGAIPVIATLRTVERIAHRRGLVSAHGVACGSARRAGGAAER